MQQRLTLTVIALTVTLFATSCGADEPGPQPATTEAEPPLTTVSEPVDEPGVSSGMGPGITVSEALESTLAGPLLVNGFVITGPDGTVYLSEGLAESLPPQPAFAQVIVEGLELGSVPGLTSAQGISWTDQPVQLLGELADGVLTVSTTSSG